VETQTASPQALGQAVRNPRKGTCSN
jgi:hypothetical protein